MRGARIDRLWGLVDCVILIRDEGRRLRIQRRRVVGKLVL